jgi:GTPase SAR1 family protein
MARTIQIGIHGPRSSGKTCFLASLYGKRTEGDAALQLPDNSAIDLLGKLWEQLEQGKNLEANARALPNQIRLSLTHEGKVSRVLTADYAGELVQRMRDTENTSPVTATGRPTANEDNNKPDSDSFELTSAVLEWMKASDALLLIVDAETLEHDTKKELEERRNEIDLLITELQKGQRLAKPLALVVTKWDLYATPPLTAENESKRLHEFIETHDLLSDVTKAVEMSGKDFRIFPVSAFGGNFEKKYPPKDKVAPFNTLAPLVWCVERVRKMRRSARMRKLGLASGLFAGLLLAANVAVLAYEAHLERRVRQTDRPAVELAARVEQYEDYVENWLHWRNRFHWASLPSLAILISGIVYCRVTAQVDSRCTLNSQRKVGRAFLPDPEALESQPGMADLPRLPEQLHCWKKEKRS